MTQPTGHHKPMRLLENSKRLLPMEDRFLAAAQRVLDIGAVDSGASSPLRPHQMPALLGFRDYLTDLATLPGGVVDPPFCRIVLPPRTGKTVVAGELIFQTGLRATFVVPTKTLVVQTRTLLADLLPEIPIGTYYSAEKHPVRNGINITTYTTLQRHFSAGCLPAAIRHSALIFVDEAHHAMTPLRMETLNQGFDPKAIRLALTATPDYGDHRRLDLFFPRCIHQMGFWDAIDQDLLAPTRMWVAEVDADASVIRVVAGDYEPEVLGRLMSSSPFFQAVRRFRYAGANRDIPALITCASRQQAYDLSAFLKRHKPRSRPLPAMILGETPETERARVLQGFEDGRIDTLIQVGVLIEGWNAPRCKLLVDLAPTLSVVRATQKYFRVMTRHKATEARIVVILPSDIPRPPVLPIDLLLTPGQTYDCGSFINSPNHARKAKRAALDGPLKTPVQSVRLKSRLIACAELVKPSLDPRDHEQIRRVLESCPEFSPRMSFGRSGFGRLFFNHPTFVGSGELLLRFLGISGGQEAYFEFIYKLYAEKIADLLIEGEKKKREVYSTLEQPCLEDFKRLARICIEPGNNGGSPDQALLEAFNALCGGALVTADAEMLMVQIEQAQNAMNLLDLLGQRSRRAIVKRLGLYGEAECTWSEIAEDLKVSVERARQIYLKAIEVLQKKHKIRSRFDPPLVMTCEEPPDFAPIVCRFALSDPDRPVT